MTFPEGYKDTFTKYHTINFPATKQVRYYYANKAAVQAAKAGKPLPDGSVLFAEVYAAKLDADEQAGDGRRRLLRGGQAALLHRDGARRRLGQGHPRDAAQRELELRRLHRSTSSTGPA